jgi:hypothetical protein
LTDKLKLLAEKILPLIELDARGFFDNYATGEANDTALIQLKGTSKDGHIFGDIDVAPGDTIEVTQGKTFFDGTINAASPGTLLDIFDDGILKLCQEGATGSCNPGGVDGPSVVHVDTFTVQHDGTIAFQLTPLTGPGHVPQVFANTANTGGTLFAAYLPGLYGKKTVYEDVIFSNTPINGAGTGVNGTGFLAVEDNSLLLQTTAFLDENNHAVDLLTTRTAFNQVPGLTHNEKAVAGGLEKAFSKLSPSSPPNSFNQLLENMFFIDNAKDFASVLQELSGAQYAQVLQSVLFSLNPLNESITDRMDCNLNQPARMVVAGSAVTAGQQPFGCFTPHQVQAWARVWAAGIMMTATPMHLVSMRMSSASGAGWITP